MDAITDRLAALAEAWLELMRQGRCREAWQVSDEAQRVRQGLNCSGWPRHLQFIWNGESLAGKRVLIRCYHGLGDTIQFVRFVQDVREMARSVVLWVQPHLIPLLKEVPGIDVLLPLTDGAPPVDYDVDIELGELLHALRVDLLSMPPRVPYLHANPRPLRSGTRPAIGVVWKAGEWNASRSIPCELLAPFGELSGIDWWVLQRGPAVAEWRHAFGRLPEITDILQEARVLRGLDLVITVDTASTHLAGALGVPVWTLLPQRADWRWLQSGETTPWYPTMRLFRQSRAGVWEDVLARVRVELKRFLDERAVVDSRKA
ncbi:MAG: ADP-heptose--LPS heptosyltransferase [Steroidobacteraceae bacterium]|nr:ADP-heptose--LPS heptosyltransferase [Steroidobacteraceae bacterium]